MSTPWHPDRRRKDPMDTYATEGRHGTGWMRNPGHPCQEDPELFFTTDTGSHIDLQKAKRLCGTCKDKDRCLAHALAHNEVGIWGGKTEGERRSAKHASRVDRADRAPVVITHGTDSGYSRGCRCQSCTGAHTVATRRRRERRREKGETG